MPNHRGTPRGGTYVGRIPARIVCQILARQKIAVGMDWKLEKADRTLKQFEDVPVC